MANADLSIKVGVDNADLLTGMEKSKKSLQDFADQAKRFKQQLETATDPQTIIRLNKALEASNERMKQIKAVGTSVQSGFSKMSKGANEAGQSLTNLGRIAQDAPYGFIGIQNNLNPLLESFQRLKAETGTTGGALKALGSSLIGVGGVGLALSVASAAVLFFQSGLISFGGESKKAAAAAKEFADSLDDARASGIASGLQLQAYADIAANTNNSLETRNEALEKANKIMGEHGEKLTLVNIATKGAREEIEKFTQATIQQALASKFADKAADLIIARAKAFKEFAKARDELNKVENTKEIVVSGGTGGVSSGVSTLGKLISAQGRYNDKLKEYESVTQDLGEVTNDLNMSLGESSRLFGELGTKPKVSKTDKKDIETISDVLAKLARQIAELSTEEDVFGFDKSKEKVDVIRSAIKRLIVDFKVDPKDKIITKLFGDMADLRPLLENMISDVRVKSSVQILIDKEQADKEAYDKLGKVKMKPVKIPIGVTFDADIEAMTEKLKALTMDLVDGIGASIGKSISEGGGFLSGVLETVMSVMGEFLIKLGRAAVLISKTYVAIKAAASNPITGIVAGIAAIVAGNILKNIKLPKFADGVTNFGGGMAIVGERGPELVRLPKGSDVIPNGRVNGMAASGASVFIPAITLRGQDLVIAFNRASQTISRNG